MSSVPVHAQCPDYVKGRDTTEAFPLGNQADLPPAFALFSIFEQNGLWMTPVDEWDPTIVPGTEDDYPAQIDISDDGAWVFFIDRNNTSLVIQRLDGTGRTGSFMWGVRVGGFYRLSPKGSEIFYLDGSSQIKAVQVDLTGQDAEILGTTTRTIADMGYERQFNNSQGWDGGTSVVGNHIFGREDRSGYPYFGRTSFWTIPDSGNGTAGVENIHEWASDTGLAAWGCGHTMSHDGTLCLANSGLIGSACADEGDGEVGQCYNDDGLVYGSACLPNRRSIILHPYSMGADTQRLDHKGFYITRFWEDTDPVVPIDDIVDKYGASVNWAPPQYRRGEYNDVDFTSWHFSNDPRYVVGAQKGARLQDFGFPNALWVIEWTSNTWTRITPDTLSLIVDDPAMFITDPAATKPLRRPSSMVAPASKVTMLSLGSGSAVVPLHPWASGFTLFTVDGRQVWHYEGGNRMRTQQVVVPADVAGAGSLIVRYHARDW